MSKSTTKKKKKAGLFSFGKVKKSVKAKPKKEEKEPTTKAVTVIEKKETSLMVPKVTEKILLDYMAGPGGANLTQIQKKLFMETAKSFNLHPLKREVYAIAYWNKQTSTYDMSIITGYEVYLKRAERSGKLSGWKVWTEGTGNELKACINIWRKDFKEPVYHEVYAREYNTGRKIWGNKPITMIKKVAMAQGFRLAFPDELGGVPYTEAEGTEEPIDITPKKKPEGKKPVEPGMAETPSPEPLPEPSRQAQDLLLSVTWKKLKKFNPDKFTDKFYADSLEFVAPGIKATKDLAGPQITALIGEMETQYKSEREANNGE